MIRNENFLLTKISDCMYLVPFGQAVAERRKMARINSTGVFVWGLLAEDISIEEIVEAACEEYEADESEVDLVRREIIGFIQYLEKIGAMSYVPATGSCESGTGSGNLGKAACTVDEKENICAPKDIKRVSIAGFEIEIINYSGKEVCAPELKDFQSQNSDRTDMTVEIGSFLNRDREIKKLLGNWELSVGKVRGGYWLSFYTLSYVESMFISEAADLVRIGLKSNAVVEDVSDEVMRMLRIAFSLKAQKAGYFFIHSVSILYKDRLWLFSAPAGTGKSTHAHLWEANTDARIINGDINLIKCDGSSVMAYGTPWCGTSGIYTNARHEVGGVYFLKRAGRNEIIGFEDQSVVLNFLGRSVSPTWTSDQLEKVISFSMEIADKVDSAILLCTPDTTACDVMKAHIDALLNGEE